MKRLATTILAVVGLAGCFDDPTSSLRNGPSHFALSVNQVFTAPGESTVVEVTIQDDQGNAIPGIADFASGNSSVATAAFSDTIPGQMHTSGLIVGVAGGETYVHVTAGGVADSVRVVVIPTSLSATIAATGTVGTPMTVTAPAGFSFDPAAAEVFVNGLPTYVTAATAASISFAPPPAPAGSTVEVVGVLIGTFLNPAPIPLVATITVTDPAEPGNDAPAGGTALALPTNVGQSVVYYAAMDGDGWANTGTGDLDDFFTITTTTADSIEVSVEWPTSDVDIDALIYDPATGAPFDCVFDGCQGVSGADPEVFAVRLAAGTTYKILAELWDSHGTPMPHVYRITITKR